MKRIDLVLYRPSTASYVRTSDEYDTDEPISAEECLNFYNQILAKTDPAWHVESVRILQRD